MARMFTLNKTYIFNNWTQYRMDLLILQSESVISMGKRKVKRRTTDSKLMNQTFGWYQIINIDGIHNCGFQTMPAVDPSYEQAYIIQYWVRWTLLCECVCVPDERADICIIKCSDDHLSIEVINLLTISKFIRIRDNRFIY